MAEDSTINTASFLDLAGSKLRARLGSNLNEAASAGVTSKFARRHLEKLGWEEGTGLGKRRSGIVSHIKVQRRVDEQGGLGKSSIDENLKIGDEWWKNSVGNTLAKLGKKKNKKKKGEKEKKKAFTDEELFEATGGARFGMRAGKSQKGKWTRTEHSSSLKEQEQEAKQSVEWDGQTAPKVILSSGSEKLKKRKRKIGDVTDSPNDTFLKDKKQLKKRKEEKKKKKKKTSG